VKQHAAMTEERWSRFDLDRQVLMIANEMNRTTRLLADADPQPRRRGYERILRLTDLTIALAPRRTFRREMLRWRDLIAALYMADTAQPDQHRSAFRVLLLSRPVAAQQIPLLLR